MTAAVVVILIIAAALVAMAMIRRADANAPVPDDPETARALAQESGERVKAAQTEIQRDQGRVWPH